MPGHDGRIHGTSHLFKAINVHAQRGITHSSHGGRKAYLNFELKDLRPPEAARLWRVLDFKVQIRSGQPCDEWDHVADMALCSQGSGQMLERVPIRWTRIRHCENS